jgi:hypothetical protein
MQCGGFVHNFTISVAGNFVFLFAPIQARLPELCNFF